MADRILNSFDIWITAQGWKSKLRLRSVDNISLEGITRLRELILELAIRGKLVTQVRSDEPASKLLENIAKDKELLIIQGKIKRQKALPKITHNELQLPKGWEIERLGNICFKLTDGSHNPPGNAGSGYPMLSSQNVNNGVIDFDNPSRFVSEEDFLVENQRTQIEPNDVLLTIVASLGRSAVVPSNSPKFVLQRSVAVIRSNLDARFLALQLVAPDCLRYYEENGKGTAQKGIYLGQLALMALVIPPLSEQHRIVAKVDELMALCDELEQQETNHLKSHQLLVETLLGTLTQAKDAAEFQTAWATLAQHFDDLFITEDSIDQLKQTILQLAVMGKLVKQDPKDEPASEILHKIEAEKKQLIIERKLKKEKTTEPFLTYVAPFELPQGWVCCKLGDLIESINNGLYKPESFYTPDGIISLRMYNIQNGAIDFTDCRRLKVDAEELSTYALVENDILVNRVNSADLVGKSGIVKDIGEPIVFESMNMRLRLFFKDHIARYVNLYFQSSFVRLYLTEILKQAIGQASINQMQLRGLFIPLPPIHEQELIVTKVDELFALCDRLKERIGESQKVVNLMSEAVQVV